MPPYNEVAGSNKEKCFGAFEVAAKYKLFEKRDFSLALAWAAEEIYIAAQ